MIERLDRLLSVETALSIEVAHQLLLLRVDAQNRVVRPHVLPLEPGDILELLVAVDMLPHREGLAGLALDVVVLAEQLLDHGDTDRCARLG